MARVAFGFPGVALLHQHSSIVGDSIGSLYELVWGSMDLSYLLLFRFLCLECGAPSRTWDGILTKPGCLVDSFLLLAPMPCLRNNLDRDGQWIFWLAYRAGKSVFLLLAWQVRSAPLLLSWVRSPDSGGYG